MAEPQKNPELEVDDLEQRLKELEHAEAAIDCAYKTGKVERSKITQMAQLDAAEAVAMAGIAMEADEEADEIKENAEKAEEAAQEANRSKERAFLHDCGYYPDYCMYERAAHLAGLSGGDNPLYYSVDTWSFSVALERARHYYFERYCSETPSGSVEDQARSALRKRFYDYAIDLLDEGYVSESEDSFEAYFPLLPSNTSEMRSTPLYTEQVYPVTIDTKETQTEIEIDGVPYIQTTTEQSYVMHAWSGCPNASPVASYGSIRMLEGGGFKECPVCKFRASSMGKVAAASTSIPNGFEYHYREVAREAEAYEQAREEERQPKEEVEKSVSELIQELVDAMKETVDKRIAPEPPGRYGSVAFVVNTGSTSPARGFASGFVSRTGRLGPRAAIAGATLLDEGSDAGSTVLNSVLDNLRDGGGVAIGAAGMVLDAWSWLVCAYGNGQAALQTAIADGLNGLPLVGASGLGTWAADKLKGAIDAVGLQPAEVGALKPVLVNSGHVAAKSESGMARLVSIKQRVVAHPMMSTDLFASVLTDAEQTALARINAMGDSFTIASVELLGEGGPAIPITIPIPQPVKDYGLSAVQSLFGRVRSFYIETTGVRIWE